MAVGRKDKAATICFPFEEHKNVMYVNVQKSVKKYTTQNLIMNTLT